MDDLDRMLSGDDAVTPSSGFAARVMEAVQQAADEPPPLRFPWWRFAVGVLACIVWAAAAISLVARLDVSLLVEVLPRDAGAGDSLVPLLLGVSAGTLAACRLHFSFR